MDSSFILADICITYLSLQDFENDPLAIDDLGNCGSDSRKAVEDYIQKYAFLGYAATDWAATSEIHRIGIRGHSSLVD